MKLRDYLSKTGVSQVEFAKRCGLPQTTIAAIVTGGGTRAFTAIKIIHASGGMVTLDDLVGENTPTE